MENNIFQLRVPHIILTKDGILSLTDKIPEKCPVCKRRIVKVNDQSLFFSTRSLEYDLEKETFKIKCRSCKAEMRIIFDHEERVIRKKK